MIKLEPEDVATFEALNVRNTAQAATFSNFLAQYQILQDKLVTDSLQFWADIKLRYHLEGDWRVENGKLIAMSPAARDTPSQPGPLPPELEPFPAPFADDVDPKQRRETFAEASPEYVDHIQGQALAEDAAETPVSGFDAEKFAKTMAEEHDRAHPPKPDGHSRA